jgi:hypothetical protein
MPSGPCLAIDQKIRCADRKMDGLIDIDIYIYSHWLLLLVVVLEAVQGKREMPQSNPIQPIQSLNQSFIRLQCSERVLLTNYHIARPKPSGQYSKSCPCGVGPCAAVTWCTPLLEKLLVVSGVILKASAMTAWRTVL